MVEKTIGLIDLDGKRGYNVNNTKRVFPNLALMKLSSYYKQKGFKVEWYSPLFHQNYYKIFASKVFQWSSPKMDYLRSDVIVGGSGFNLKKKLPNKIEHIYPDYALYGIDYALGFITRGCIRNCSFCVVPEKEGPIRKHANLEEFCKDQEKVILLDNNFLAYKDHEKELIKLIESRKQIDFNQGLDIRLITPENAFLLKQVKMWSGFSQIRFAFDDVKLMDLIERKLEILFNAGITNRKIMFYVLVGYNSTEEEDLTRINFLKDKRIDPYVMSYNRNDPYQKAIARYVNRKPIFWSSDWLEYKKQNLKLEV